MNAQISIIIKSFEINNSVRLSSFWFAQKKERGQNCNEKNRGPWAKRPIGADVGGQATFKTGAPPTAKATFEKGAPADQRRPSDREGPLGQATERAVGKRPIGSADRRSPPKASDRLTMGAPIADRRAPSPVSLRSAQGPQGPKGAPIADPWSLLPNNGSAERRSKNSSAVSKIKAPQTEQTILFLLRRHLRSIRLPKTRTLYTVLRSPHIDKKSREQFEMKIHKQCFFIQSETKYLRTQLLLLKLQDIPGVQCKIVVNYKTPLGLLST
jgi:Ribosomal protein S10p/S20e